MDKYNDDNNGIQNQNHTTFVQVLTNTDIEPESKKEALGSIDYAHYKARAQWMRREAVKRCLNVGCARVRRLLGW